MAGWALERAVRVVAAPGDGGAGDPGSPHVPVRHAKLIPAVDGGRILERGADDALVELGGLYAELHRTQFRPQASDQRSVHKPVHKVADAPAGHWGLTRRRDTKTDAPGERKAWERAVLPEGHVYLVPELRDANVFVGEAETTERLVAALTGHERYKALGAPTNGLVERELPGEREVTRALQPLKVLRFGPRLCPTGQRPVTVRVDKVLVDQGRVVFADGTAQLFAGLTGRGTGLEDPDPSVQRHPGQFRAGDARHWWPIGVQDGEGSAWSQEPGHLGQGGAWFHPVHGLDGQDDVS